MRRKARTSPRRRRRLRSPPDLSIDTLETAPPPEDESAGLVLVVDDLDVNREVLGDIVESGGYRVATAASGAEAIEKACELGPDVILLDVRMPVMDGFETCRRLKEIAETAAIPVVFVTANLTGEADEVQGLEVGGYDYLVKPVSREIVLARVGVMVRIRRSEQRIRELSMFDELTRLHSRRYAMGRLDEEIQRAERKGIALTVSMVDIDDFKSWNDSLGHLAGDRLLVEIASVFQASVRAYDSVGRYGGEEFLLVQPEATVEEVLPILRRLLDRVGEIRIEAAGAFDRAPSFSAGVAAWERGLTRDEIIHRADVALFAAKRKGKCQTVCWDSSLAGMLAGGATPR